jgi:hypothetical protein
MPIEKSERELVKKQVLRLAVLNYFLREKEFVQEYIDTLADCCRSQEHVKAVVDRVLESVSDCPAPAEFRRIARDLAEKFTPARPHCDRCGGTGFVVVRKTIRGVDYEGMDFCSCRREQAA